MRGSRSPAVGNESGPLNMRIGWPSTMTSRSNMVPPLRTVSSTSSDSGSDRSSRFDDRPPSGIEPSSCGELDIDREPI